MTATISKWGNSQGLRLPKDIVELLHINIGDKVELTTQGEKLIIEPLKKKEYDINELVKMIPDDYEASEELSDVVGKEVW